MHDYKSLTIRVYSACTVHQLSDFKCNLTTPDSDVTQLVILGTVLKEQIMVLHIMYVNVERQKQSDIYMYVCIYIHVYMSHAMGKRGLSHFRSKCRFYMVKKIY
jgi:hypothetical protein